MMAAQQPAKMKAGSKAAQRLQWPDKYHPHTSWPSFEYAMQCLSSLSSLKQAGMPSSDAEMLFLSSPSKPKLVRGCAGP